MHYSLFSALALGLSAVVQAGVSSPPAGAQWPVAQNQQITWDTTGLTGPVDIHLVPAGAVDITVIIAEIAIGVSNTGSFTWAPDSTISTPNVEIIIVDAKQVIVISEVFEIIIVEVRTH
jgi:Ser-Thr-rich glycosyl-phosphatidyl-inositol-anchored membrane family